MIFCIARSPIYSHLSTSIQGIIMIRSCRTQNMCIEEFSQLLDEYSRVHSIILGMNRWSALRVECIVAVFIGFLAFSFLLMDRSNS